MSVSELPETEGLFTQAGGEHRPLAARMRPRDLEGFAGQQHLLGAGKPLRLALERGNPHSMVLWGPPGSGKTTLAWIVSHLCSAEFIPVSAVSAGVKDVREAIEQARRNRAEAGCETVLFMDEVHRFNKAQQDAFLYHVENGTIIFIGATTENPSFELNNALLSRVRVYVLKPLEITDLTALIDRALMQDEVLCALKLDLDEACKRLIAQTADGDARKALNLLEICADLANEGPDGRRRIDEDVVKLSSAQNLRRFDKGGDLFYDQISAFHKSVRGSDPDAALYWLARMLDGGCDPLYVARRMLRIASEDVGNANLRAWDVALNAGMTYERLGSPDGEFALGHAAVYLACSPKSNAVDVAFGAALSDARKFGTLEVPMHLRNAPTRLMKQLGHGKGHRHPHDEEGAFAAGEVYFPKELAGRRYYEPTDRGSEAALGEHLKRLRELNRRAGGGRAPSVTSSEHPRNQQRKQDD